MQARQEPEAGGLQPLTSQSSLSKIRCILIFVRRVFLQCKDAFTKILMDSAHNLTSTPSRGSFPIPSFKDALWRPCHSLKINCSSVSNRGVEIWDRGGTGPHFFTKKRVSLLLPEVILDFCAQAPPF